MDNIILFLFILGGAIVTVVVLYNLLRLAAFIEGKFDKADKAFRNQSGYRK